MPSDFSQLFIVALQKPEQQVESAYVNAKDIELLFEIKQVRFFRGVCLRFSCVI